MLGWWNLLILYTMSFSWHNWHLKKYISIKIKTVNMMKPHTSKNQIMKLEESKTLCLLKPKMFVWKFSINPYSSCHSEIVQRERSVFFLERPRVFRPLIFSNEFDTPFISLLKILDPLFRTKVQYWGHQTRGVEVSPMGPVFTTMLVGWVSRTGTPCIVPACFTF